MTSFGDYAVTVNKFDIETLIGMQQTMQKIVVEANAAIEADIDHPWTAIGQLQFCAEYADRIIEKYRGIVGETSPGSNG